MALKVADIRLVHREVGTKHVYTSPDVPGLHVSHADREKAFNAIQGTLDMLERMKERVEARKAFSKVERERMIA